MSRDTVANLENQAKPTSLLSILRAGIVSFVLLTLITGVIYPLVVTAIAKAGFSHQAEGSLIDAHGVSTQDEKAAVGSTLIGQVFDQPQYFWSRPSATSPMGYNAASSSGSNTGPSAIADTVKGRVDALKAADPANASPIPVDLVTASGSGLDPQESVAAAEYQIPRIARIRGISPDRLKSLITQCTANPDLGVFGEPAVNVLQLNLALDAAAPYTPPATAPATASQPATAPAK